MNLDARLTRIEHVEGRVNPYRPYRFCHIVASDAAAEAVRRDVISQGHDPDRDLLLIRLVPVRPVETAECET